MKEEIYNFGDNRSISGILNFDLEAIDRPCVIFINAGVLHKIGPNRLHAKLSRNLSDIGISSFRFDFSGLGDSDLNVATELNPEESNKMTVIKAIDFVQKKTKIDRFILFGICSGANDAFQVSLIDHRVVGVLMIDSVFLDFNIAEKVYKIAQKNTMLRYYKKNAFSLQRWKKIIFGKSNFLKKEKIILVLKHFFQVEKKNKGNLESTKDKEDDLVSEIKKWDTLKNRKVNVNLIFCEGDKSYDIFNLTLKKRLLNNEEFPNISYIFFKDVDHTFTPIWSQEMLKKTVVDWIKVKFDL